MENMPRDNYVKELGSSMSEPCHASIDVGLILLFCLGWGFTSTFSWVEPVQSNEDEVSCSRTPHRAPGEIRTRDLAIK